MARRIFGTDGVRGIVGEKLTVDLVERLGRAAALWATAQGAAPGGAVPRFLIGRDTRGSGPELEQALARGIASGGGVAVVGGVLPTPAVALLAGEGYGAPSEIDARGWVESEFEVLDRRGNPAPWLERKLTEQITADIENEIAERA